MKSLHYKVVYRNGDRIAVEIADFYRTEEGHFIFEYVENPRHEFPGFSVTKKKYENDSLWEQVTFRIPNSLRNLHPDTRPEELLKETDGKLVTDHFEFQLIS